MRNKSLIFLFVLIFMVVFSLSAVSADDLQSTDSGEVSGDVDVVTINPWNTSGELTYEIPSEAKEIKSAELYVNVYAGSAKNTHGSIANVSLNTVNGEKQIATEQLWIEDGSTDGTIYVVNNHTNKCYSDYQMNYDLTDYLKGLNGSSISIKVDTFKMENKTFDGRIKLIALILAYDDGDNDKINYWIDSTQKWTKTNVTTIFSTENLNDIVSAELVNVALSSADGSFILNDELIGDAINHTAGNYYQYNYWVVSSKMKNGQKTELVSMNVGTGTYASLKNVLSVLKVQSNVKIDVSLATEYTSVNTCYAGTNNTLTINVNSDKKGKYVIELLADDVVVDSSEIELDGENQKTFLLTDPTIRPVDETTVNGANNTKVTYAVNVKFSDNIVASANKTVPVLYNGNLGKDFAYNASYIEQSGSISVTGGIVVDIKDDSTYLSAATLNRTDIWEINLSENSSFVKAFIYVPYNWFNPNLASEDINMFNTTFNDIAIVPISIFRDQGNLGNYGKYGYGLLVYDVTNLIAQGNNSLVLNKIAKTPAVYPSTLVYLYDTDGSDVITNVYFAEGADLLSNGNNNAGRIAGTDSVINVATDYLNSAMLYIFAASAQAGEGNVIFNGDVSADVWNGSTNSVGLYSEDITNSIANSNSISFVATGSTILALNQIIVTTQDAIIKTTVTANALSTTYDSGKTFTVNVLDKNNKPVSGLKLALKIYTGSKYVTKYVTTNANGVATFKDASTLAIGTHKVIITSTDKKYDVEKTSSIKVDKAKTSVKAPKVTAKVKKSKYFKVTVKNKANNKAVKSIKVKIKVFTGKKSKIYTLKTNSKGIANLNTKSLKVGLHKVVISSGDAKYTISAKSTIVIKR